MTDHTMSTEGRCHRILRRLSQSPCGFTLLLEATRRENEPTRKARDRLKASLRYLVRAGLVLDDGRQFSLTAAGTEELERLDGEAFGRPSCRVFVKAAA